MKRGRSTLILLVLAAALGGYIWFVEREGTTSDDEPKAERVFASLDQDAIAALTVKAANGDETSLKKGNAGWTIESPIQVPADASEVSGVTSNLATLDITRVIDEKPASLEPFGLESPRISLTFTAKGPARTLLLGAKTTTGGDVYAKLADAPRVFLVPSFLEQSFDRTTFQLRNKTIVNVERDTIDRVAVIGAPGTIELRKDGDSWRLVQPLQARADGAEVGTLLTRLTAGQMQAIVAEQPATLDTYGLQPARTTVTATAGGRTVAQVLVGGASGEAVHAKDAARPMVFTVEKSLADDLQRGVDAYRSKDVFAFRMFNLTRLVVTRGTAARTFEKKKSGDGKDATDTWAQTSPVDAGVKAATIEDVASRLSTLRAEGWTQVPATSVPVMTIQSTYDGSAQERVQIVQAGDQMLALRDGEPGAARLTAAAVTDVLSLLDTPSAPAAAPTAPAPTGSPTGLPGGKQ
ncbi:MAG TPA: DUF4340 domain-containing protein [Luteitalea sp.]|nr:DUF4340 domain-containing protein [Luteitalea sp.]